MTRSRTKLQALARTTTPSGWLDEQDVPALRGNLAVVSALDIVQLVCTNGQSWRIRLWIPEGEASMAVVAGELVDARWGRESGEAALVEIVGCRQGRFELEPIVGEVARTLREDWRVSLLQAVQALDERTRKAPESHRRPAVSSPSTDSSCDPVLLKGPTPVRSRRAAPYLIDLGFAALRDGKPDEARHHWTQALFCDPDNRTIQLNLRKLDDAGNASR